VTGKLEAAIEYLREYIKTHEALADANSARPIVYRTMLDELVRLQATNAFAEFWVVWGPLYRLDGEQFPTSYAADVAAEAYARKFPGDVFFPAKVLSRVVLMPAKVQWDEPPLF